MAVRKLPTTWAKAKGGGKGRAILATALRRGPNQQLPGGATVGPLIGAVQGWTTFEGRESW